MTFDYDSFDLRQELEPELYSDEELMWVGKPRPLSLATKNLTQSLFGIFWLGVVIFMFVQFRSARVGFGGFGRDSGFDTFSSIFQIILVIFVIIGIGTIFSPVWRYLKATRTLYGLTDQRAIIMERLPRRSVRSYAADDFAQLQRSGDDLRGDIIFKREVQSYRDSRGYSRTRTVPIGFYGIQNPREIERLMLDIANK